MFLIYEEQLDSRSAVFLIKLHNVCRVTIAKLLIGSDSQFACGFTSKKKESEMGHRIWSRVPV